MGDPRAKEFIVGIAGASGVAYGLRLVEELLRADCGVQLLITDAGRQVLAHEAGLAVPVASADAEMFLRGHFSTGGQLRHYAIKDLSAPPASGSNTIDGMIVCPCSMGSVGRIASGLSENLLERAADVSLKERRHLILVPRETPISTIHLENLLRLSRSGVTILPAMPGFYQGPKTVDALVDFVVAKILSQLGLESSHLLQPWGGINQT
ncbi:MAG: aromatic acid decarboxylase [Desulfuromonas sp.]|nr:MAG: aromatic acid decarboxylase [Desulfuromonas sp.]